MGSTRKFWKGIVIGAIAGGAVALFDKETRRAVIESCKNRTSEVTYYIKHPNEAAEQVKETTNKLRSTVEDVSEDISFIAEKVEELKEITPSIAGIVKDTKDTFLNED